MRALAVSWHELSGAAVRTYFLTSDDAPERVADAEQHQRNPQERTQPKAYFDRSVSLPRSFRLDPFKTARAQAVAEIRREYVVALSH